MQSKLQSITEEEYELRQKHRQLEKLSILDSKTNGKERQWSIRPKSQLSAEDINLLKKLKKEHREF